MKGVFIGGNFPASKNDPMWLLVSRLPNNTCAFAAQLTSVHAASLLLRRGFGLLVLNNLQERNTNKTPNASPATRSVFQTASASSVPQNSQTPFLLAATPSASTSTNKATTAAARDSVQTAGQAARYDQYSTLLYSILSQRKFINKSSMISCQYFTVVCNKKLIKFASGKMLLSWKCSRKIGNSRMFNN